MHIGLNLVFLTPGEQGGMETYARELIAALGTIEGLRLTSFVNRAAADAGGPWREFGDQLVVDIDARRRTEWVRAEQQMVPPLARRAGVDLVHSLASTAPLWGGPVRVTTIHDLNYKMVPDTHSPVLRLGMGMLVGAAARRSHRIIVPSVSTLGDLEEHLGVSPEKVDVVAEAAGTPAPELASTPQVLQEALNVQGRRIVLSPSAKRPHKNLERLLRALAQIPPAQRPLLVVPGYPTQHEADLRELAGRLGIDADLRMPGWLSRADMEGLYAAADCMVFPSLYEGFGLPVLEAMARGVPVACSNRSSLPEIAGEAALLFDPEREVAIGQAIIRLLREPALRERLRAAGLEQASRFSWRAAAEGTVASYERALT